MKKYQLSILLVLWGLCTSLFAQPGALDVKFGSSGVKTFSYKTNISSDSVAATALQPDGKLVIALVDNHGASTTTVNTVVIRLRTNGEQDNTFGLGGKVNVSNTVISNFHALAMTLQADGKIIVAGLRFSPSVGKSFTPMLVRLNTDGSKDETFGETAGLKKVGYRGYSLDRYAFRTVQVHQSTGIIIASASMLTLDAASDYVIAGLDKYGAPISNYGGSSLNYRRIDITDANRADEVVGSVIDQSKGIVFVSGTTANNVAGTLINQLSVVALNVKTGLTYTTFGGGKVLLPAVANSSNYAKAMAFSYDSTSLFLAGTKDGALQDILLYKVTLKGATDKTFSGDGAVLYEIPNCTASIPYTLSAEEKGKVTLGCDGLDPAKSIHYAVALKVSAATGAEDTRFGDGGYKALQGRVDGGVSLIFLPKESYLVTATYSISGGLDAMTKKINLEGNDDISYGENSETISWAVDGESSVEDAITLDGRIMACGNIGTTATLALFKTDGSYETSFLSNNNAPGTRSLESFFTSGYPLIGGLVYTLSKTADGKILIGGTYPTINNGTATRSMFVVQLKNNNGNWVLDTEFGTSGYQVITMNLGTVPTSPPVDTYTYLQDMTLQNDGKVLLYSYSYYNTAYYLTVSRLLKDGKIDTAFPTSGVATATPGSVSISTETSAPSSSNRVQFAVHPTDNSIYCSGPAIPSNGVVPVYRYSNAGVFDNGFNDNLRNSSSSLYLNMRSRAIVIKPDGSILVGGTNTVSGTTAKDYALLHVKANGIPETTFDSDGFLFLDRGYNVEETITRITLENSSLVLTGRAAATTATTAPVVTALRVSATGKLDNTFATNGKQALTSGYPVASLMVEGNLYVFGQRNSSTQYDPALIAKVKLGGGSSIKTTSLVMANLTKQYGDKPFSLVPITNSPAPVYYSTTAGTCATVDETTGSVKITCATNGTDVVLQAIQPAIDGYTADTTTATLTIAKGIPRVFFTNQGGLVDSTFFISASANSGAAPTFFQFDGFDYLVLNNSITGSVFVEDEGSASFKAEFAETDDYLGAIAYATISGYSGILPPVANTDEALLNFGEEANITIDILQNDEAYTGAIEPKLIDLDPETEGVQQVFVSPSLGLFVVDSTGIVTYTPFTGFVGSGAIAYTITDSRKKTSEPGKIFVKVEPKAAIPDLKATELMTPNNDGLNEAFVIGYVNLEKENQLTVFDRNGQAVFSRTNYQNDWTGELNSGRQAENGIYYYLFTEGNAGGQREIKGVVEIRR